MYQMPRWLALHLVKIHCFFRIRGVCQRVTTMKLLCKWDSLHARLGYRFCTRLLHAGPLRAWPRSTSLLPGLKLCPIAMAAALAAALNLHLSPHLWRESRPCPLHHSARHRGWAKACDVRAAARGGKITSRHLACFPSRLLAPRRLPLCPPNADATSTFGPATAQEVLFGLFCSDFGP